jgi:hypothetical protein
MSKPRSISAKRQQMVDAWKKWENKEIDGATRDALSLPYLNLGRLEYGTANDVDQIRELHAKASKIKASEKRADKAATKHEKEAKALLKKAAKLPLEKSLKLSAKAEKEMQAAEKLRLKAKASHLQALNAEKEAALTRVNAEKREPDINTRLAPGELKVIRDMEKALLSGKKTVLERDESVQRWRDAAELAMRKGAATQAAKVRSQRQPGVPWKGGQLRSGSMAGQRLDPAFAAFEFASKYAASSMPKNGIMPNVNIRGQDSSGEVYIDKIPVDIMEEIKDAAKADPNMVPNIDRLMKWILDWCRDNDIDEIDLFADDADLFDT